MKTKILILIVLYGSTSSYCSSSKQQAPLAQPLCDYKSIQEDHQATSPHLHSFTRQDSSTQPTFVIASGRSSSSNRKTKDQHRTNTSTEQPPTIVAIPPDYNPESRCECVCAYFGCAIVGSAAIICIALHLYDLTHRTRY